MSMFSPVRKGTWYLHSKIDPRWNVSGKSLVGSFVMPSECGNKLEQLEQTLGNPPSDLKWGYMKD